MHICAGKKCQLFTYVLQLSILLYTPFPFPSPYQPTVRTFICRHLSRFCHLRWVAINASPLPLLRCQLIKIDAKYAKSRENPRGKFSKFSQLISQVTHAQQITGGGRGKCDWLLLFAFALPISPPLPHAYNVHGIIATPPASLKQLVPSTSSVCLHLRIIDACREASLTASQSQLSSSLLHPLLVYLLLLLPVLAGWRQQ